MKKKDINRCDHQNTAIGNNAVDTSLQVINNIRTFFDRLQKSFLLR